MCEVDKVVRNFVDSKGRGYRSACKMDERYTDHKHPDRRRECCGSRTVWNAGRLESRFDDDDDYEMGNVWDPFSNTERDFRVTNECGDITEEDAGDLRDILSECAEYFSPSLDGELVQCAGAAQIVDPVKRPDLGSPEYMAAIVKVVECSGRVPGKCMRGDGAGVMDALLSLLPAEAARELKGKGRTKFNMARIMVPVTGEQWQNAEWKEELMGELNKLYFFENGEKALGGGSKVRPNGAEWEKKR
jgi:hypothetical protein